jgi:hypothetical protein
VKKEEGSTSAAGPGAGVSKELTSSISIVANGNGKHLPRGEPLEFLEQLGEGTISGDGSVYSDTESQWLMWDYCVKCASQRAIGIVSRVWGKGVGGCISSQFLLHEFIIFMFIR